MFLEASTPVARGSRGGPPKAGTSSPSMIVSSDGSAGMPDRSECRRVSSGVAGVAPGLAPPPAPAIIPAVGASAAGGVESSEERVGAIQLGVERCGVSSHGRVVRSVPCRCGQRGLSSERGIVRRQVGPKCGEVGVGELQGARGRRSLRRAVGSPTPVLGLCRRRHVVLSRSALPRHLGEIERAGSLALVLLSTATTSEGAREEEREPLGDHGRESSGGHWGVNEAGAASRRGASDTVTSDPSAAHGAQT